MRVRQPLARNLPRAADASARALAFAFVSRAGATRTSSITLEDVRARYPAVWHIDRAGAEQNREESLRGWPTRAGFDRDEVPAAVAAEGGKGADVRLVRSSENLFFDPARVTDITINYAGLKLTFHDSIYVGMSGG